MNETQLKEFYDLVTSKDSTYSSKVSFDSFKQKMQSNDYASRLMSWAGVSEDESIQPPTQQQPPVQQRPVANAYNAEDLLKKKSIQSVSSSDQSSSASTSEQNEEEPKPLYNVDPKRYETKLPQQKEQEFQKWLDSQVKLGRISQGDYDFYKRNGYGYNYDFRAAFLNKDSGGISPVDNQWHWGDYGKKPNHPTFSVESVYNMRDGMQGGVWGGKEGEDFMAPFKPQPAVSEGTRAGVPPIQQQQQVKQQIQKREEKRVEKMTQSPQFFKDQISGINADLMSKEEEYVVPQLNYKFGPMGFKFEESGVSNQITVTAPNGKQKTIDLLYGGIPIVIAPSLAVGGTGKAMEEADVKARTKEPIEELKQFVLDNSVDTKDLSRYESLYAGQKAKYETTKQAEDSIKSASDEYNAINAKINSYSKESAMADKMFEELNKVPEDQRDDAYNKRYDEAIEMKQRAIANANSIDADRYYASSVKYKDVEKSVGDYFMMKSEQGTWMGGLANRALKSTGSILAGAVDVGILGSSPQLAFTPSMVKGRDELRSGLTNFFIDNFKDKSTTEQWDAATSQSTVKGAILGLGGMIPAMVAGAVAGPAGFMGAFAAEGYNDTMIEAQEAGIPPGERELVAIPVGITMGVIGELGLDKIPGAKVFAKQVTAKALKALGADFTATTFKNFVQNEIKSSIARGVITAGKGFAHGFEMGVKMDVGTNLIKDTYNVIKDKRDENENYMKVFNTPDSIAEYFSSAVESGISMGIGAAILASPEVLKSAAAKNNFNGISDSHLEMFDLMSKDDMFNSLTTLKVKQDIIDGKITKEQGELQLRSYQELASLMKSLPDGLTNAQKRKALGLLQEKVLLKSQIEKGDPALTKKQRDRVTEIDNFLGQISEGKYSEVSEIKPEDVKVTIGDEVMWNPDVTKEMEQWDVAEVKDDSVILTKGEETQTIPLKELQQHITDTYAVQKPTANESVLRAKQSEMGLQEMVEGDQELDVVKTEEQKRKEEIETALAQPDNGKGTVTIGDQLIERTALETELADINKKMEESTKAAEPEKPKNEIEDLLDADTSQKDNLKKVYDFLDRIDKNLTEKTKFGAAANEFMRFFPLETLRLVVKGVKVLVEGGMKLRDAIKKVSAENKVSEDDVKSALSYAKEKGDLLELPDYEKTINEIQDYADFSSNRKEYWESKVEDAKKSKDKEREAKAREELKKYREGNFEKAMEILEKSETYKSANDIQKELLVRDLRSRFEIKEIEPPSTEQLFGDVTEVNKIMEELNEFFDDAEKSKTYLEKYYNRKQKDSDENPNSQKLRERAEKAKKELDEYDTKNIGEAITRLRNSRVYQKASREQKVKMEEYIKDKFLKRQKLRPSELFNEPVDQRTVKMTEMQAIKEQLKNIARGAKSVIEKIKEIKDYVDSVEEYGNLTRKDLRKIRNEMLKVKDEKSLDKAVDKINDIIDNAKTDIIEISELKMIKDKLKGIKDAKKDLNEKRKLIAAAIDFIAKSGKINAKKVGNMLNSLLKVNLNEDAKIEKIIEYVENSFLDAEYDAKRGEAKSLLSSIKKLSKNIEVDANYKKLAEEFKKINASEVADIDLYIENAKKLNEAMKGAFGKELKDSASINELSEYTEERLTEQREAAEKEMQDKLMELGVDATGLSMKEMKEVFDALSDEKTKPSKEQEKVARDTAKKAFDTYSAIIKEMLSTKKDPFTGEPIEFTETQRDLIERFMKMDLDLLSGKESIAAANSLLNFITNGSISKMGKVVEKYEKLSSIKNVADKGIIAKTFRAWWSTDIGKVLMEQIATLPNVFSRAFKNDKIGDYVMKALGLSDVIQMHMKAVKESNAITDEYVKEFYNKKGKEFRSDESTIERGMLAFMLRSKPGAEAESFADRKKLIEDSIEVLSKGDERQQKMSDVYQKVYEKILSDSKTADEVRSKSNADNVEAVDWWVNKWAEKYDGLSDVLESVYNKILGNDINYTPDKVKLVDPKQGKSDLNKDYSVFLQNNGLYMEESGVLMEKKIKNELPDNRYIDLSFDLNNTMSMHDALVDMYTAAKVEGLNAAINSPFFAKIFPNRADRNLVKDLTEGYVRDMRQKTISDMSEINSAARKLGAISSMGVSMSLAGPTQILKQSIPIMVNTLINAGPVNMLSNLFSRGGFDFIDSLDMPISIRGKEATTQLQSVNRLVELAARSNRNEAMKIIEVANKKLLKWFLTNPDVYVAKASWLAYYEKYMKDNKLTKGPIDFRTEKLNQEAADYAQKMVDKNQNVSIRELQGKMFKTKDPTKRFLVQMFLPFANYRMNQKTRMGNDMATIWSKTTSLSDKGTAARSLVATGVESLAFRAMSGLISYTLWNMTNSVMGRDVDDEEKEKYIDNLYKGGYTALVTDFVSPIPNADPFVASGANTIMRKFQEDILNMEEDEVIGLFDGTNRKEKLQALGLFGIPLQRANQIAETIELANTGEFKDDFGRTKILDEEDQEAMKTFAFISMLSITGISFPEMNTIIKGGIKMAKKNASVESALSYEEQQRREESKQQKEKEKSEKIQSVDELIGQETDEDVIRELNQIKTDLQEGIDKQERIEEKEKMEKLLQGYESKSDMKRYDPVLYEETFGEGSDYYEENKAEMEAEKKLSKYMKKKKDEEYDYIEKRKKKKESDSFFEEEKTTEFFKSKNEGGFFD